MGEDAFRQAAAHHLNTHPPTSWTIDEAGRGFDRTCAELFAKDPEVAELAWLEWAMLDVFTGEDIAPLDPEGFARSTASFNDEDWAGMRVSFLPGAVARQVGHDLRKLWTALKDEEFERPADFSGEGRGVIVWREGERPTFLMVEADEVHAFVLAREGMPYGELCLALAGEDASPEAMQDAAMRAGAMLGRWLNEGLIAQVSA